MIRRSWVPTPLGTIFDEFFFALPCMEICQKRVSWKNRLEIKGWEVSKQLGSRRISLFQNYGKLFPLLTLWNTENELTIISWIWKRCGTGWRKMSTNTINMEQRSNMNMAIDFPQYINTYTCFNVFRLKTSSLRCINNVRYKTYVTGHTQTVQDLHPPAREHPDGRIINSDWFVKTFIHIMAVREKIVDSSLGTKFWLT